MAELTTPWTILVEMTLGCNRLCPFCGMCGIQAKPGGPYQFMTLETADALAEQCASFVPTRRYEFAMRGEPTMNPKYLEILSVFRNRLPKAQIMVTTNGVRMRNGKMEKTLRAMFAAGVDFILLDTYEPERHELRQAVFSLPADIRVIGFYSDEDCPNPYYNHGRKVRDTVFVLDDLSIMSGTKVQKVLSNHCGNAETQPDVPSPLPKKCVMPFRQIVAHWNGDWNFCCNDFGSELSLGNVYRDHLRTVWNGEVMQAIRACLFHRDRRFPPCSRCDYPGGMRQGLLPKMDLPTATQRQLIKRCVAYCAKHTKLNTLPSKVGFSKEEMKG